MPTTLAPQALQQFVDDEMLRAPLLFDLLVEDSHDRLRKSLPSLGPLPRAVAVEVLETMQAQRQHLADHFLRSLREQVQQDLAWHHPRRQSAPAQALALALVDEDTVVLDVELSHAIELIKNLCEHELRDLLSFTSALVGDMHVTRDHNPFRAETYARALGAAVQALPLSTAHQVALMHSAGLALAPLLRKSYAAASSRLEAQGIEPAAYRTVILPSGVRSAGRFGETTFSPDLHRMRDSMSAPLDLPPSRSAPGTAGERGAQRPAPRAAAAPLPDWNDVAGSSASRAERQAVELVSRLFDAMRAEERVPDDAGLVIASLRQPALRLSMRDTSLLEQDQHPLWRFINRLVFEAQMTPDPHDPERVQLLRLAQGTADQLAAEPEQNAKLHRWACERLESFLQKRFLRRLSAASSHIGALQKLEDKLASGQTSLTTMHGMLDVSQLDTVPAELMEGNAPLPGSRADAEIWLDGLMPGEWVRLFLQGRWVHAALLWPGERSEVWLFGDGGSDATWAVRRGALLMMHGARLAKRLKQRSIVSSAALRVHQQMAAEPGA